MFLEKWRIEEGWILCKIDGLQCSINCPQIKWGSTRLYADHPASAEISADSCRHSPRIYLNSFDWLSEIVTVCQHLGTLSRRDRFFGPGVAMLRGVGEREISFNTGV
jgi:hypothetical protein